MKEYKIYYVKIKMSIWRKIKITISKVLTYVRNVNSKMLRNAFFFFRKGLVNNTFIFHVSAQEFLFELPYQMFFLFISNVPQLLLSFI